MWSKKQRTEEVYSCSEAEGAPAGHQQQEKHEGRGLEEVETGGLEEVPEERQEGNQAVALNSNLPTDSDQFMWRRRSTRRL